MRGAGVLEDSTDQHHSSCDGQKNVGYYTQWSLANIPDFDPMIVSAKIFEDHWVFIPMVKARMKF